MERFSISISSSMKKQLELMAKANFRNLNGEINKALDDYIKQKGVGVDINALQWWEDESEGSAMEPSIGIVTPQVVPNEPNQSIPHQNEPISTTLFSNDEIEEF